MQFGQNNQMKIINFYFDLMLDLQNHNLKILHYLKIRLNFLFHMVYFEMDFFV